MKKYIEWSNQKAKQEQKSDVYAKLLSYPPPNAPSAPSGPPGPNPGPASGSATATATATATAAGSGSGQSQGSFKRILLVNSRKPYLAAEDKMSLYHAREYFCNALYAISIWKAFFAEKRQALATQAKGKSEDEKESDDSGKAKQGGLRPTEVQVNLGRVKLESLINLVPKLSKS